MSIHLCDEPTPNPTQSSQVQPHISEPITQSDSAINLQRLDDVLSQSGALDPDSEIPGEVESLPKPLLVMNINIGDGKTYELSVLEDDDPYELAKAFCKQHDLEENVAESLAHNIYDNMEQILQEAVVDMNQSYRVSPLTKQRDSSPFTKQPRDLLEPEPNEERIKRRKDSEEEDCLEQIEKNFGEEAENSVNKESQLPIEESPIHLDNRNIATDISPIGRSAFLQESENLDMSICTGSKPGSVVGEDMRSRDGQKSIIENRTEGNREFYWKTESSYSKGNMRCQTAWSPQKSPKNYGNGSSSPTKSPNQSKEIGRTYGEMFQKKERQRQKSECLLKHRNSQTYENYKTATGGLNTSVLVMPSHNKIPQMGDCRVTDVSPVRRSAVEKRTQSAMRPKVGNAHERLFNEHKQKEERLAMKSHRLTEEYTFTPQINSYSGTPHRMSFEERNRLFLYRVEKHKQMKQESQYYDNRTGQPLFYPATGRAPIAERNHNRLPIGEYLYNRKAQADTNPPSLKEIQEANVPKSNEKSQVLVERKYRAKIEELFNELDSDKDGVISATCIDINNIDTFDLHVIAPVLCAMEELNRSLTKEGFTAEILRVIKNLCIGDRDRFILGRSKRPAPAEPLEGCTFRRIISWDNMIQPEINKKSVEMAKVKRTPGDFQGMYDKLMMDKKAKEEKIRREQEKKREMELQGCSFRPNVLKKPVKSSKKEVN